MRSPKKKPEPAPLPSIADEEWDFRGITEEQLMHAIQYEYARSTVSAGGTRAPLTLPPDIIIAIERRKAKPWTLLSESERERICQCGLARVPAMIIEPWNPQKLRGMDLLPPSFGYGLYTMSIDWLEVYDSELFKSFELWVHQNRPKGTQPAKGSGGKACEAPWDWLRQLAAWRLESAGYTKHQQSLNHAKELPRRKTSTSTNDVLPTYPKQGARFKAIESAKKRVMQGLSLIQICQRWPKGEKFVNLFNEARLAPMVIDGVKNA